MDTDRLIKTTIENVRAWTGPDGRGIRHYIGQRGITLLLKFLISLKNEHTRQSYQRDLIFFVSFLEKVLKLDSPLETKRPHVDAFMEMIKKARIQGISLRSPASFNKILASVSSFFEYLANERLITSNPCANIRREKIPKKKKKVISVDEFSDLIDFIENHPVKGLTPAKKNIHLACISI